MNELIEEFRSIHKAYGSSRNWKLAYFHHAQVELFHLAQAIGTIYCRTTQFELDKQRRKVVNELKRQTLEGKWIAGASVMAPAVQANPRRQQMIWSDYQITPEISCDPELTGRVINRALTIQLNKLLKIQTTVVRKITAI